MRLQIQTSSSDMIPITDMRYIFDLARCSKCQMFILSKATNKLYGASDDCCSIHEIDVPFLVNTDLMFRVDPETKAIIDKYDTFFIPALYSRIILPSYYWEMYKGGDLEYVFNEEVNQYILIDKTTSAPIDQIQMHKYRDCDDFDRLNFIRQLDGYLNRLQYISGDIHLFMNMENDENIRRAYDNKISEGRILCRLNDGRADELIYFYKGLFSLGKSDTLNILLRYDTIEPSTFMVTFEPKKKKNPLKSNVYGAPYSERIHCMYISLK